MIWINDEDVPLLENTFKVGLSLFELFRSVFRNGFGRP